MSLKPEQIHSPGWHAVKEYAAKRLVELRSRLEGDLKKKETTSVRASIKELKRLLDLETPDTPQQEIDQDEH
jgi:hypothetical protein